MCFNICNKSFKYIYSDIFTILLKSGLGLQNLVTQANEKFLILQRASEEFIRAVGGENEFSTACHLHVVKE